LLSWAAVAAPSVSAQTYRTPSQCYGCHVLGKKAWQASHSQTLIQLSAPEAVAYARSTGGDPKHPRCLVCHAPLPLAAGPGPVACDSCHGPPRDWFNPHKSEGFYGLPAAEQKGMNILFNDAAKIAKLCVDCHVLDDRDMVADRHPSGATFDAGRDLEKMIHWPGDTASPSRVRTYNKAFYDAVSRAGAPMVAARAAAARKGAKPAAKPPARRHR
jgi:hypothetical protein